MGGLEALDPRYRALCDRTWPAELAAVAAERVRTVLGVDSSGWLR